MTLTSFLLFFASLSLLSAEDHSLENEEYRDKAREMFLHAYRGYMTHAYPADELKPLSCTGRSDWGNFSLTLIDCLDTLVTMGLYEEFSDGVELVQQNVNFSIDKNVSVFETNIRVVGGLLSAHLLYDRAGLELPEGWPCAGPLLDLAVDVAGRLLPAFATPTGLPYGTTNLMYGVPRMETTVTGTAGCGTFLLEFGMLSRLTGDPAYEHAARRASRALFDARSHLDLVGNHIDVARGEWIFKEAGIGGNVDSYYEYLLKAGLFFEDYELVRQFKVLYTAVVKHLQHDFWYIWSHMFTGQPTLPSVSTLDAFWPSLQILIGDLKSAGRTLSNFYSLVSHYGFTPEMFSLLTGQVTQGSEIYPLRPEFVESLVYMYQATGDQMWRNMGKQVLDSIEVSTKSRCGYATVSNVVTHQLEDKMESFFLSETTKYLYLLFSDDHWLLKKGGVWGDISIAQDQRTGDYRVCAPNSFGFTFTTEAHPLAAGVLGCCHPRQEVEEKLLDKMFADHIAYRAPVGPDPLFDSLFAMYSPPVHPLVFLPALPAIYSPLDTCDLLLHFLAHRVRSHKKHCLSWQQPADHIPRQVIRHECKAQPWFANYEVYGVEFVKVEGKKAFKVLNSSN